ncbi:hypothetical protein [Thalassoglobus polymorphus]|uniref:Porin domain-containing protein n=1 Tax=Thalassoglobus polymorphus TaxID=2527994 RepID=A0A517QN24_9PLAN|nr:hypothetical protein [Thalassoglobus polymorphus]QDT33032.1 hypothetical protein Mal48_22840 [Thalassoglobus polymorphus]
MLKRVCLAGMVTVTMLSLCQSGQAQVFFESDWLYYGRDSDSGRNVINGPESKSLSEGDFDYTSGYRLTLGGSLGDFDVDASFSQLDAWESGSSGIFNNFISMDGVAVPGDPGVFNSFADYTALNQAASYGSPMMGNNELTEGERLRPFNDPIFGQEDLVYSTMNRSNFREFEINVGSRRNVNWYRFSVGYRHIQLDERSGLTVGGVFDALDVDDGNPYDGTINDDPNNGLSNAALISTGMAHIGGSADGYDAFFVTGDPMMAIAPDLVAYQMLGKANNQLNGAQATVALRIINGEWITVEGIGKAGIYRNSLSGVIQETVVGSGNDDSVYRRTLSSSDTGAAFAGNLGLRSTVSLTDYINVIMGYEVLFLSGVALGAEQNDGLSTDLLGATRYQVQNDGTMIAHGSNLGLEILW